MYLTSGSRAGLSTRRYPAAVGFGGLVPGGGIEPPRAEARRILSPLRLPVPPSRHFVEGIDSTANFAAFWFVAIPIDRCETG